MNRRGLRPRFVSLDVPPEPVPDHASSPASESPQPDLEPALHVIRSHHPVAPEMALILGSGLGALADAAEDAVTIETHTLPGYPRSTVEGHQGRLVFGRLGGRPVVFVQGRVHLYEGHPVRAVAAPVRLVHALGARRLLLTNAAGGINPLFTPGTLMLITGHLNMAFANPLVGAVGDGQAAGRWARDGAMYDPAWIDEAEAIGLREGIRLRRGVYVWTKGPSYETPAEVRAFGRLGADAVGMSTVPEAVQARHLGMRVLGISTITNPAAGLSAAPLLHEDVLEVGQRVRSELTRLVRALVATS